MTIHLTPTELDKLIYILEEFMLHTEDTHEVAEAMKLKLKLQEEV